VKDGTHWHWERNSVAGSNDVTKHYSPPWLYCLLFDITTGKVAIIVLKGKEVFLQACPLRVLKGHHARRDGGFRLYP
jgi:hypothetical protein